MERVRSSAKNIKGKIKNDIIKSEIRRESQKIFSQLDANGDKTACEEEIADFVSSNDELWSMLSANLHLPRSECRSVATRVAMELASGLKGEAAMKAEIDKYQFHAFRKRYMLDPKGSQEFFHRAVFAAFDRDNNGLLDEDELEDFLDIFYKSGSIFKGDIGRMPPKDFLKSAILKRFDRDGNGQLDFGEIRRVIRGEMVEEVATMASQAETAAEAKKKVEATRRARELAQAEEKIRRIAEQERQKAEALAKEEEERAYSARVRQAEATKEKAKRESKKEERKRSKSNRNGSTKLNREDEEILRAIEAARKAAEEELATEAAARQKRRSSIVSLAIMSMARPRASFAMTFNCYTAAGVH